MPLSERIQVGTCQLQHRVVQAPRRFDKPLPRQHSYKEFLSKNLHRIYVRKVVSTVNKGYRTLLYCWEESEDYCKKKEKIFEPMTISTKYSSMKKQLNLPATKRLTAKKNSMIKKKKC